MPRARRADLTRPFLHLFTRGADRQDIFTSDGDRVLMEQLLGDAVDRFGIAIHTYAFMHNHVHLIVERSGGDVSRAMQFVFARYASAFNQTTNRTGPVFNSRFGSTEITSDAQLLQCSRYVHLNPLEFVPHAAISAFRWSSLGVYAGRREPPDWLTTSTLVGPGIRSADSYLEFVLTPQASDRHGRPVTPWRTLTLTDVDDVIDASGSFAFEPSERGGASMAVAVGIEAALALRIGTSRELTEHHDLASPAAARSAARRVRARAARDPSFAAAVEHVIRRLRHLAERAGIPELERTERR